MNASPNRAQVRDDLARLVHRGVGVHDFTAEATRILRRVVGFDGTCLLTMDPATYLLTGEVVHNGLPAAATRRLVEIELSEPDVNKFAALARKRRLSASLGEATEGELERSLRQREVRGPLGMADELRTVLPGPTGTWAALTLSRGTRRPHFSPADAAFMASSAELLGEGIRRAMLLGAARGDRNGAAHGIVVVAQDSSVERADAAGRDWLTELGASDRPGEHLPFVVDAVVARARRTVAADPTVGGPGPGPADAIARARVRTHAGRWVVVRGSTLGDEPDAPVAVLFEAARAPELAPLIVDGYGFTERERRVTELVARGFSTHDIAGRLHLSAYTVQDHLKSIFDKSGTGTRGELVARLFVDHNAPGLANWPSIPDRQGRNGG